LFKWKTADRGVTSGIWFHSKPFVVKTAGKYIGVLLMDTQGLFDTGTSAQADLRIFGLSLSLSSHQILNVKGNIDRQLFDKINLFSSYANDVSRQIDEFDAGETSDSGSKRMPSQRRVFKLFNFFCETLARLKLIWTRKRRTDG